MGTRDSSRDSFRERVYRHYLGARASSDAPESVSSFAPRIPYLRRVVTRHFPSDLRASCVDLGCGHGALLHVARSLGYTQCSGWDRSPAQVAAASRLGIPDVHEGDLLDALRGMRDATHDVVVSFDVIEHFTKDELLSFIDEVHRVLKPGGRWLLHTPNGESPFVGRVRYGDITHELAFTRTSLSQLLLASNFSRVTCFEDSPVPHGLNSSVRAALWPILRFGLIAAVAVETGELDRSAILTQNFLTVAVK